MTLYPTTLVTRERLRRMFAELYEARIESGLLTEIVIYDRPASVKAQQPAGTRSEVLDYADEHGRTVVRVHRFITPGGAIGASGLMGPIMLLHEGRLYTSK